MRKLKRRIDDMGIKKLRALSCLLNGILVLMWIQLWGMHVPLAEVLILLYFTITLIMYVLWRMTPDGIPSRGDIRRENDSTPPASSERTVK